MKRFRRISAPILGALLLALCLTGSAFAADKYVALGDSYSAGNGANSTNLDSSCNRNTYAYPYLLAQQKGLALSFVACAGAVTQLGGERRAEAIQRTRKLAERIARALGARREETP